MINEDSFDDWNELKKSLDLQAKCPVYHERDIWWYAAGKNIGSEINGKGQHFLRPILIVRKYGRDSFFGVPLSTREGSGMWYSRITIRSQDRCALLSQASSYSVRRLYNKICRISNSDFKKLCVELKKLIFKT